MLTKIVAHINAYLKSHVAGLSAAGTLLIADLNAGRLTGNDIYAIVGAYLGTAAIVAIVPNTPAPAAPVVDVTPQDVPA